MRNRKLDLNVGQEVVIADINDGIRYLKSTEGISLNNIDRWCNQGVITKLGRKYITVKIGTWEYQYDKERNYEQKYTSGSADSRLYLSIDEIKEEWESDNIYNIISNSFSRYNYDSKCNLNLDQLKRIKAIIEEK